MRKRLFFAAVLSTLLCCIGIVSCGTSAQTVAAGLENTSYLHLVGDTSAYTQKVTVVLDDEVTFEAEVSSEQYRAVKSERKGLTYKIAPGVHDIKVLYKNETIINKKIFASANEVNTVELP